MICRGWGRRCRLDAELDGRSGGSVYDWVFGLECEVVNGAACRVDRGAARPAFEPLLAHVGAAPGLFLEAVEDESCIPSRFCRC
jgi:hypothetical protein